MLEEDFSSYDQDICFLDGVSFGPWRQVFGGYGCVSVADVDGVACLSLKPMAAQGEDTHAALVVGPVYSERLELGVGMRTAQQLRTEPNPWEVAWVVWGYTDPDHFIYFMLKPTGVELGLRDPSGNGGQVFIDTYPSPILIVGKRYDVRVAHEGEQVRVWLGDELVIDKADARLAFRAGAVGFYTEDARALFDSVELRGE